MARNTYDFDLEELVENYGVEFLMEHGGEQYPISMDEFDEYFDSPYNAVLSAFNGGRYGFKQDPYKAVNTGWRVLIDDVIITDFDLIPEGGK